MIFLGCLALLIAGCNKFETVESSVEEPTEEAPRHLIVNISVNKVDDTRAVKLGWMGGDKIYVVFDHFFTADLNVRPATAYFMTLTYNGDIWQSKFSDPALEAYLLEQTSGKLAAAYCSAFVPEFIYMYTTPNNQPAIKVDNINFIGFHMSANKVDYTVENGVLTATLPMSVQNNDVYFSIPEMNGDKSRYTFQCEHFAYDKFSSFHCYSDGQTIDPPRAVVAPYSGDYGKPIKAAQIDESDEYYFCASLNPSVKGVETEYAIQIIDNRGTEDEMDDVAYTLTKTARLFGKEAIELPPLTDPRWMTSNISGTRGTLNGHEWVLMGDGKKWATLNIGANTETDCGTYMNWYDIDQYIVVDKTWAGWKRPTYQEWKALAESSSHLFRSYGGPSEPYRVKVEVKEGECKGNILYLPVAGYKDFVNGVSTLFDRYRGYYWTSWYSIGQNGDTDSAIEVLIDSSSDTLIGFAKNDVGQPYVPVTENTLMLARLIVDE